MTMQSTTSEGVHPLTDYPAKIPYDLTRVAGRIPGRFVVVPKIITDAGDYEVVHDTLTHPTLFSLEEVAIGGLNCVVADFYSRDIVIRVARRLNSGPHDREY